MNNSVKKWVTFSVIALGLFSTVMEGSMIGLALPSIASDLFLSLPMVAWLPLISTITIVACLLPVGNISDRLGRKNIYLIGALIMGIGSLWSALSLDFSSLIGGRNIVGIGSAMRMATGMAMIVLIFPPNERGKGLGANATTVGLAAITGPILGGILVQYGGWQSIFWIQVFASILVIILGILMIPSEIVEKGRKAKSGKFDFIGSFASALGFSLLILILNQNLGTGFFSTMNTLMIVLIFLSFGFFVIWELRFRDPIFDLRLFKNLQFSNIILTRLLAFSVGGSFFFLMPFYFQLVKNYEPANIGLVLFPGALGMALVSSLSGRLSDKFGIKKFVVIGISITVVSLFLISNFDQSTNIFFFMPIFLLQGCGMGLWATPNNTAAMNSVKQTSFSSVSAMLNLIRTVGMGSSLALSSAIVSSTMIANGVEPDFSREMFSLEKIDVFLKGFRYSFLTFSIIGIVPLILSLFSKELVKK